MILLGRCDYIAEQEAEQGRAGGRAEGRVGGRAEQSRRQTGADSYPLNVLGWRRWHTAATLHQPKYHAGLAANLPRSCLQILTGDKEQTRAGTGGDPLKEALLSTKRIKFDVTAALFQLPQGSDPPIRPKVPSGLICNLFRFACFVNSNS